MFSIIKRILAQIINDKRSLAILFVAPILIFTLLYFILGDSGYVPKITVYNVSDSVLTGLEKSADVEVTDSMPELKAFLESQGQDAIIWANQEGLHLYMLDKSAKTSKVLKAVQDINASNIHINYEYETNSENQLDSLSFVFLGVISFFFVFILSGMSFVRERTNQTLERMLMAPIRRSTVIGGYTLGYGILSAIQSVVIFLFSVYVLKLHVEGSYILCTLIMIILSFAAVSVGALMSIFANNELQLVQFIPIVLIPQIFFSGLIPLDTIPYGLGNLCYLTPIYYGCAALQKVLIFGDGIDVIYPWILGLLGMIVVLFVLNTFLLKKYRRL